jgi:CRP/FNR family transcriptional regulator, dissimilatory nitrate respiration regulator
VSRKPLQIKTQAFLANLPMFSEMSGAELDHIAAATLPVHVSKGESVFQCGDPCANTM